MYGQPGSSAQSPRRQNNDHYYMSCLAGSNVFTKNNNWWLQSIPCYPLCNIVNGMYNILIQLFCHVLTFLLYFHVNLPDTYTTESIHLHWSVSKNLSNIPVEFRWKVNPGGRINLLFLMYWIDWPAATGFKIPT